MTFLTADDFKIVIRQESLDKILQDNPGRLEYAVEAAMDEIVSFTQGRYDMASVLSTIGDGRNYILVMRAVDMALYHLFSTISPRNIPDLRRDRYAEAIELFKGVQKGLRFLDLPVVPSQPDQNEYFLYGSNKMQRFL